MANCNNIFTEFNSTIRLTDTRKASLKVSRNELRKKIRKYFSENRPDEIKPKFKGQGSYIMDTIVNPIPRTITIEGVEKTQLIYDVDDGVYFIGDERIEDRKSIQTYHNWIVDAIDGHTSIPPIDKNTCVRTVFADGHHIDMPIYYKQNDVPELAHKKKGWIDSDPKEFADWFNEKANRLPQLRRIVRYLKAWKDYREFQRVDKKMPSGLILTILAYNNYYVHERDDISLKETLVNIENALLHSFTCYRPTTPAGEDLLDGYVNKDYFLDKLRAFIKDAKLALEVKNQRSACELWQNHFGSRMPCSLARDGEDNDEEKAVSLLGIAATSKPWTT